LERRQGLQWVAARPEAGRGGWIPDQPRHHRRETPVDGPAPSRNPRGTRKDGLCPEFPSIVAMRRLGYRRIPRAGGRSPGRTVRPTDRGSLLTEQAAELQPREQRQLGPIGRPESVRGKEPSRGARPGKTDGVAGGTFLRRVTEAEAGASVGHCQTLKDRGVGNLTDPRNHRRETRWSGPSRTREPARADERNLLECQPQTGTPGSGLGAIQDRR
jgi:hypothetical protein